MTKQYYSWEDVKEHTSDDSMWVVANNNVYDVTDFWKRHPGGSYLIKSKAGTDVTKFNRMHLPRTLLKWEKYHIGYIITTKYYC